MGNQLNQRQVVVAIAANYPAGIAGSLKGLNHKRFTSWMVDYTLDDMIVGDDQPFCPDNTTRANVVSGMNSHHR
jgi:hypothetical protein